MMQPLNKHWYQPTNAWWWLATICTLGFTVVTIMYLGTPLFVIDLPAAILSCVLFVGFSYATVYALSRSKYTPEPGFALIGIAFLVGAFISIGLTLSLGSGVGNLTTLFGTPIFSASFGGAVPEETLKLFCVVVILNITRRWVYHPAQLMLIGMAVGLGFDIFENMSYGINGAVLDPNDDLMAVASTWGIRLITGPLAHMVWTGIAAWGIGQFIFNKKITGIGWFFFSLTAHFMFNAQWPFDAVLPESVSGFATIGVSLAIYITSIVVLVKMWRSSAVGFEEAQSAHMALVAKHQAQVRTAAMAQEPMADVPGQASAHSTDR